MVKYLFGAAAVLILVTAYQCVQPEPEEPCKRYLVKSILKSEYRTVTVEIEGGYHIQLYTPTVKPGDMICVDDRVLESVKGK